MRITTKRVLGLLSFPFSLAIQACSEDPSAPHVPGDTDAPPVAASLVAGAALDISGLTEPIIFESGRDGNSEIYAISSDGTDPIRLTDNPSRDFAPALSPDKTRIAFNSWRDGNSDVFVLDLSTGVTTNLTRSPTTQDLFPAWSPDGSTILFVSSRDGGDFDLFTMNADGSGVAQITSSPYSESVPSYSPDGTRIAFLSEATGWSELYIANADGSNIQQLTSSRATVQGPEWSTDGTRIAFSAAIESPTNQEIYTIRTDGTGLKRLTTYSGEDREPAWSSDATRIVFNSNRGNGTYDLFVMNAEDGSGLTRLTYELPVDAGADWRYGGVVVETNVAPTVATVSLPLDPVQVGTLVEITAEFADENTRDVHTAEIDWGLATTPAIVTEVDGAGVVGGSYTFAEPGVYTITVSVSDGGLTGSRVSTLDEPAYVVVYDPSAGFVTGGGWIDSPEGACRTAACALDGSTVGKATFGFVSRYQKGSSVPEGNTEFQFKAGELRFKTQSYEWLVVSGTRAQFKGRGAINDEGDYGFLLTALDAEGHPTREIDEFRIKIWDVTTGEVAYDNRMGESEESDAATPLSGGSIKIHRQ